MYAPDCVDKGMDLERGRGKKPEKIILRSQNFGSQKSKNIAILGLYGAKEAIVLSVFFRWHFSSRNDKKYKSFKNRNFWISAKKVPSKKI